MNDAVYNTLQEAILSIKQAYFAMPFTKEVTTSLQYEIRQAALRICPEFYNMVMFDDTALYVTPEFVITYNSLFQILPCMFFSIRETFEYLLYINNEYYGTYSYKEILDPQSYGFDVKINSQYDGTYSSYLDINPQATTSHINTGVQHCIP